jgi:hypothetical protein
MEPRQQSSLKREREVLEERQPEKIISQFCV